MLRHQTIQHLQGLEVAPELTDITTLIPFLKSMKENLNFKYLKIVADAGYESEENYSFIEENNQISFIKPSNYETSKTRKYKNDISRIDNIDYEAAVFTNLTQDHLDFHKTLENYKNAKEKLFYKTKSINIFNIDDKVGEEFFNKSLNRDIKTYTYGVE